MKHYYIYIYYTLRLESTNFEKIFFLLVLTRIKHLLIILKITKKTLSYSFHTGTSLFVYLSGLFFSKMSRVHETLDCLTSQLNWLASRNRNHPNYFSKQFTMIMYLYKHEFGQFTNLPISGQMFTGTKTVWNNPVTSLVIYRGVIP